MTPPKIYPVVVVDAPGVSTLLEDRCLLGYCCSVTLITVVHQKQKQKQKQQQQQLFDEEYQIDFVFIVGIVVNIIITRYIISTTVIKVEDRIATESARP